MILPSKELISEVLSKEVEEDAYVTELVTKSGKIIKVMVHAKVTANGHPTITGSITLLEE